MTCAGCVSSVEKALTGLPGVSSANVNFAEHTATVSGAVSIDTLISAVRSAGYDAAELKSAADEAEKESTELAYYYKLLKMAAFAAVVGFPQFILGMTGMLPNFETGPARLFWLGIGLLTAFVLVYSGGHFFRGA